MLFSRYKWLRFTYNLKNNKFVIPLLVSGIYAEISRRYDVSLAIYSLVIPVRDAGIQKTVSVQRNGKIKSRQEVLKT
jgi:hypothetical protein